MTIRIKDETKPARRDIRKASPDVQRLARALKSKGIDPRTWFSSGTVGILTEEGAFDTDSEDAIWIDELGCRVSVRLEPSEEMVTARWAGLSCGAFGRILLPIFPGDEVVVGIPDGDYNHSGVSILSLHSNWVDRIPENWANDRVLIDVNQVLEIRAAGVDINSANLFLNGRRVGRGPGDI